MNKILLLKLHRWVTMVFALPLLALVLTGLVLSFEPVVQAGSIAPGSLEAERLAELIARHDPSGKARGLSINAAASQLVLRGAAVAPIDLTTGELATSGSSLTEFFLWCRQNHERLVGQSWLVVASTIAMLVIMVLGILMGLPRIRNTVAGWHKATAWFLLPLLLLSPLTGLCLAFGLTFQSAQGAAARPLPLVDAVRLVARSHDLAATASIAVRGGRTMARIFEAGELRSYAVTADGVTPLPRNWPRLLHEGNWLAFVSGPLNVVVSVALLGLLGTGLFMWSSRKLRRRPQRPTQFERGAGSGKPALT